MCQRGSEGLPPEKMSFSAASIASTNKKSREKIFLYKSYYFLNLENLQNL